LLKETIIISDNEEFILFKKKCIKRWIKSKQEFFEKRKEYELYYIDKDEKIQYINDKEKWKTYCNKNGITHTNYIKKVIEHECLPRMPEELYKDFTNFKSELGRNKRK
jgi:hypothetical protein